MIASAVEHHAVLDAVEWLVRHEGAEVTLLPVDELGRVRADTLRAALDEHRDEVAVVTAMWANNEVGTVQPAAELAALCAGAGVPFHTDAVQAVDQATVDFAAGGAAAMTVTAHKLGGPIGVGALVLGRDVDCTPLLHGGGQERDVRSGTLDVPGIVAFATAVEAAVNGRAEYVAHIGGIRDALVAGVRAAVPDAILNGDPVDRLPGNAHFSFPGCEGDALLLLLDAQGIACSTGSACSAGVAQPSHVLLAMGADDDRARSSLRFSLGHTSTKEDADALVAALPPAVGSGRGAAPAPCAPPAGSRPAVKVLAAMSGGVDSAVAAARAVDAGYDVTGVHLALARNPQTYRTGARGCCTLEDSRDARRAADVIGIPFYVWDMADRFHEDVVDDFVAEYAAGRTPNPCLRCNEKIKFAAVLDRAVALGFDAVVTGHHARLGPDGLLRRSVDLGKDQSYVLAVLTREQLDRSVFPLGDSTKAEVRAEAAARGLAVADKPDSHDICFIADGDTRRFLAAGLGATPGDIVDAGHRRGARPPRRARTRTRWASAAGSTCAARPATAAPGTCCRSRRSPTR